MDSKKAEQSLKYLFDIYGIEIVRDRRRFRAAIFDMLAGIQYGYEK